MGKKIVKLICIYNVGKSFRRDLVGLYIIGLQDGEKGGNPVDAYHTYIGFNRLKIHLRLQDYTNSISAGENNTQLYIIIHTLF